MKDDDFEGLEFAKDFAKNYKKDFMRLFGPSEEEISQIKETGKSGLAAAEKELIAVFKGKHFKELLKDKEDLLGQLEEGGDVYDPEFGAIAFEHDGALVNLYKRDQLMKLIIKDLDFDTILDRLAKFEETGDPKYDIKKLFHYKSITELGNDISSIISGGELYRSDILDQYIPEVGVIKDVVLLKTRDGEVEPHLIMGSGEVLNIKLYDNDFDKKAVHLLDFIEKKSSGYHEELEGSQVGEIKQELIDEQMEGFKSKLEVKLDELKDKGLDLIKIRKYLMNEKYNMIEKLTAEKHTAFGKIVNNIIEEKLYNGSSFLDDPGATVKQEGEMLLHFSEEVDTAIYKVLSLLDGKPFTSLKELEKSNHPAFKHINSLRDEIKKEVLASVDSIKLKSELEADKTNLVDSLYAKIAEVAFTDPSSGVELRAIVDRVRGIKVDFPTSFERKNARSKTKENNFFNNMSTNKILRFEKDLESANKEIKAVHELLEFHLIPVDGIEKFKFVDFEKINKAIKEMELEGITVEELEKDERFRKNMIQLNKDLNDLNLRSQVAKEKNGIHIGEGEVKGTKKVTLFEELPNERNKSEITFAEDTVRLTETQYAETTRLLREAEVPNLEQFDDEMMAFAYKLLHSSEDEKINVRKVTEHYLSTLEEDTSGMGETGGADDIGDLGNGVGVGTGSVGETVLDRLGMLEGVKYDAGLIHTIFSLKKGNITNFSKASEQTQTLVKEMSKLLDVVHETSQKHKNC